MRKTHFITKAPPGLSAEQKTSILREFTTGAKKEPAG